MSPLSFSLSLSSPTSSLPPSGFLSFSAPPPLPILSLLLIEMEEHCWAEGKEAEEKRG